MTADGDDAARLSPAVTARADLVGRALGSMSLATTRAAGSRPRDAGARPRQGGGDGRRGAAAGAHGRRALRRCHRGNATRDDGTRRAVEESCGCWSWEQILRLKDDRVGHENSLRYKPYATMRAGRLRRFLVTLETAK